MSAIDILPNPASADQCRPISGLTGSVGGLRIGRRLALAVLTALGAAGLAMLYFNDPTGAAHRWFPPCPFHAATGLYCPGCGSTRGLHLLLHGHLLAACRMNALMVLCVPYFACAYVTFAARAFFPRGARATPLRTPIRARWIWVVLAAFILYWALRNIPLAPFTWLAPH